MGIRLAGVMMASCLLAVMSGTVAGASVSPSVSLALIRGAGSTWSSNAVNAWVANIHQQGVNVVFDGVGSAAGRTDYANGTVDFAASDIGYHGLQNGKNDRSTRPYAYLPVTAGGTSFPYNIVVGHNRITNLRLSGLTIAKIFTNQITNWNDPAITHDNNGRGLPSLPIITVVHSEGSGTTAMFTRYLNYEFPSLWTAFNNGQGGMTEYWPQQGSRQVAQDGSSQVMNFIRSASANGSIGVDEYSYPLNAGYPVVQMGNAAGYYVLPSMFNDAVALTQAQIDYNPNSPNYLLQNLDHVYNYRDPRAYPLSSYSYTIMPTSRTDEVMAKSGSPPFPGKAQALADFLYYSICDGQTYIGNLGYSALPVNLVQAGFQQIEKIKTAAPQVNINQQNVQTCHNPTFVYGHPEQNRLAQVAPYPPLCDKAGYGPCTGILNANKNGGRGSTGPNGGSPPTSSTGSNGGGGGGNGSGGSGGGGSGGGSGGGGSGSGGSGGSGGGSINPLTGQLTGSGGGSGGGSGAPSVPTTLAAGQSPEQTVALGVLAALLLVAALVTPPLLARRWSGRGGRQS
jgi:ABC-type phosphate transport system substrate-binding protein